jgi:hypothetical protein
MSFQLSLERSGDHAGVRLDPVWQTDVPADPFTFLSEIARLDSLQSDCLNRQNFQLSFTLHGCPLEWDHERNRRGARFFILYPESVAAFDDFSRICCDWISGTFPFSAAIIGIAFAAKVGVSWNCQIWIGDGFRSAEIEGRWMAIVDWLGKWSDFKESVQIEYRVHPTWRRGRMAAAAVLREANEMPSFANCVHSEMRKPVDDVGWRGFDLAVARTHKRTWAERRAGQGPQIV